MEFTPQVQYINNVCVTMKNYPKVYKMLEFVLGVEKVNGLQIILYLYHGVKNGDYTR